MKFGKASSLCAIKAEGIDLETKLSNLFASATQVDKTTGEIVGLTEEIKEQIQQEYDQFQSSGNKLKQFKDALKRAGFNEEYDLSFLTKHIIPIKISQCQIEALNKQNETEIFTSATSALMYVEQYFLEKAFKYTFINRDHNAILAYITSGEAFNTGIINMKNDLCNVIIKLQNLKGYPKKLFTTSGAVIDPETNTSYYEKLMKEVKSGFLIDFDITQNPDTHLDLFDTFASIYILNNFDEILSTTLDGIIKVNMELKGDINNTDYAKDIDRVSTVYWSEDTHEEKGIDKFVSKLAKFIVSNIQKYTQDADGKIVPLVGQKMTTGELFMISGILKQAEYEYNLLHMKDPDFKPLVFLDNPKAVLKQLLLKCDEVPIMKKFGHDLALSLKVFLYTDTEQYPIEELYKKNKSVNFLTLDIESLLAFEINKNQTPTYVEYSDAGYPELRNYGKSYLASNRLNDNITNLLYLIGHQNKSFIQKIKVSDLRSQTVNEIILNPEFKLFLQKVFEMDDPSSAKYKTFIETWQQSILDIIYQIQQFDPKINFDKLDTLEAQVELYIAADNYFKTGIEKYRAKQRDKLNINIASIWQSLKRDANKFMSSKPVTNFDDISGSTIPVNRLNSVLFLDNQVIYHYHETDPNREYLNLFVANPNLLSRYNFRTESGIDYQQTEDINQFYETSTGFALNAGTETDNTSVDKMTPVDQLFVSFVGNWLGLKTKYVIGNQPAPYSDKKSIGLKFINSSAKISNPTEVLMDEKITTLDKIIQSESAENKLIALNWYYRKNLKINLINLMLKDWLSIAKVLDPNIIYDFAPLSEKELFDAYKNNSKIPDKLFKLIENLNHWLQNILNSENSKDLRNILDNISAIATKLGVQIVDELYFSKNGLTEKLGLNETLLYDLDQLRSINSFRTYILNQYTDFLESDEVKKLIKLVVSSLYTSDFKDYTEWKKEGNKSKHIVNKTFLIELKNYFLVHSLLSFLYTDLISKGEYLDKAKFKFTATAKTPEELISVYRAQEKSARVLGMSKRMVLYPATIETFEQGKLDGISPEIKVCVVDDAKEETFNLKGSTHNQDIFDGASCVSIYYSLMENNSLPGKGIKGTKKPLGCAISDNSSTLFKYAEFELNNEMVRNSKGGKFDLERVYKKMHNILWDEDIDLTVNMYNKSMSIFKDILGRDLYYSRGFDNILLRSFKRIGKNTYDIYYSPCYENGRCEQTLVKDPNTKENIKQDIINHDTVTINSIYDLWKVLGGYECKELINGHLEYSELNNEIIAQFIYQIGTIRNPQSDIHQPDVYQPLREKMVSMIANKGAVKRGSANTCSAHQLWNTDDDISYMKVSTKNFGIQLDANHHSDLAELTEMSLTISSLAALGYTSEYAAEAYNAIGNIIENSLHKVSKYLTNIEKGNLLKVIHLLSITIVDDLAKEKNITSANAFVNSFSKKLEVFLLPVSDKRFYKLFVKNILAGLNKSSIKRKYTGLGGIINPSSNIYQLYEIGDKSYTYSDLLREAKKSLTKSEKTAILKYWEIYSDTNKDMDIVQMYIMKQYNPTVFDNIEEALISYRNLRKLTDLENDDEIDLLTTQINPLYGFTEVILSDINILDTVGYITIENGQEIFHIKELSKLSDYLEFKWNSNIQKVFLAKSIPHDLRPLIEHWTTILPTGEKIQRDTWSEPYIYLAQQIESYKAGKTNITGTNFYFMLKSLLQYVEKSGELSQMFENSNQLFESFLNGSSIAKRYIHKILEQLRIRQAELHVQKLDFNILLKFNTPENPANIQYDWNFYLGGTDTTIGIKLGLNLDEQNLSEFKFAVCENYTVDPAEVILPKIYRSNFLLGNRSLNEITPDYFKKVDSHYRTNLKNNKSESLAPIDFLIRTHTENYNIVVMDLADADYGKILPLSDGEWQLDNNGNRLFKINSNAMSLFEDEKGNKTLVILKNEESLKNIELVLNSFLNLVSILPFLENLANNKELCEELLDLCILNNNLKTYNSGLVKAKSLTGVNLIQALNELYIKAETNYKHDLANTLYNSFIKTLDIISTRIPTQALQSFMAMKVKALTNDESNNVFVSRWQLWLLGSDLDIDKSYMMGVNISKIGFYDHWSPLSDYTTIELAKISDTLPVPNGIQISLSTNAWKFKDIIPLIIQIDENSELKELIDDYILLDTADDSESLIKSLATKYNISSNIKIPQTIKLYIESQLLDYIDKNKLFVATPTLIKTASFTKLVKKLNKHNKQEVSPEAARNIIAKTMKTVSLDGRNMLSGYSPIDDVMKLFTDELKKHSFETQLRNLDNVLSTFRIQYENAVGKQDVGIMANGLKVFFCLTQYFNNYWKGKTPYSKAKFIKRINLGLNGEDKISYHMTISDIQVQKTAIKEFANTIFNLLTPEELQKVQAIVVPNDDASLLISSLVSLATDNAKELALAKLNAGINLACMHVYLTIMGYSAEDIVNYTTSPLFKDFTSLITPSQFDVYAEGRITDDVWKKLKKLSKESPYYNEQDVNNLYKLYNNAQEMTNIAKILGINQGIKVSEYEAMEYRNNFEELLINQIGIILKEYPDVPVLQNGLISTDIKFISNLLKHLGLPVTEQLIEYYRNKINIANESIKTSKFDLSDNFKIDLHRYFTDEKYRQCIVDIYDIFKETFNVFDVINLSKHFYTMLKAFDYYLKVLTESSSRAKFVLDTAKQLYSPHTVINDTDEQKTGEVSESGKEITKTVTVYKKPWKYNESVAKSVNRIFDAIMASEFLISNSNYDFKINLLVKDKTVTYNINYGKDIINSETGTTTIVKNRDANILQFLKFVNLVLIPTLLEQYPDNKFLMSLRPDLSGLKAISDKKKTLKANMKWKLNFDIDDLTNSATRNLYYDVVHAFDDEIAELTLEDVFDANSIEIGKDIKIGDILYLYDLIMNFSSIGLGSLEKIFEHYIVKYPKLSSAIAQIELDHDLGNRLILISSKVLTACVLANVAKFSNAEGIVKFIDNTQIDTKVALIPLSEIKELSNAKYYNAELLLEAYNKNLIQFNILC